MNTQLQTPEQGINHLDLIMSRVETATNMDTGESIIFIKEANTPAERAANILFDNMMISLGGVAEGSIEKVRKGHRRSDEYLEVGEAMESLSTIARGLADDQVPLKRNTGLEDNLRQEGDTVYAYRGFDFSLNGISYHKTTILIRPKRWQAPVSSERKRNTSLIIIEQAQPRMTICAVPKNNPNGIVTIRLDQEDSDHQMEITYDIEVERDTRNIIDDLEFSDALQRSGHHFSSTYTAKELGTTFEEILNAFNTKLSKSADK